MGSPQVRQRPRSTSQDSTGTLSRTANGVLQRGQCEGGCTIDSPRGTRQITTLRNEPISSPSTPQKVATTPVTRRRLATTRAGPRAKRSGAGSLSEAQRARSGEGAAGDAGALGLGGRLVGVRGVVETTGAAVVDEPVRGRRVVTGDAEAGRGADLDHERVGVGGLPTRGGQSGLVGRVPVGVVRQVGLLGGGGVAQVGLDLGVVA